MYSALGGLVPHTPAISLGDAPAQCGLRRCWW